MKFKLIIAIVAASLVIISCSDDKQPEQTDNSNQMQQTGMNPGAHKVTVEEILQANAYTYVKVNENGQEDWIAITKRTDLEEGMTLYYADAMEMKNFHSEDLDRDFESVWFVQTVSDQPLTMNKSMDRSLPHSNVKPEADESISVETAAGGITIAKLFGDKSSYDMQRVKIKGKVVKINRGIMGKNWIHIQDGTGEGENYDLTVTTNDDAQVGQIVVVEGDVALNKDFGSGYRYDIILENSKVTPETTM